MSTNQIKARAALLLVDFFHPDGYKGLGMIGPATYRAALRTAALRVRACASNVPVIYINDNFGRWATDSRTLVGQCQQQRGYAGQVAQLLAPKSDEIIVLKPRHSAFYGTPLEFILEEFGVNALVLTGIATDSCITMTAHDAHVRKFKVRVPADCVAARTEAISRSSLAHLRRVVDADTTPLARGV